MKVKWIRNEQFEADLQKLRTADGENVIYEIREVRICDIRFAESAIRNSRFKSTLDENHVEQMSVAMSNGKAFIAPCLSDDMEILSGNHRLESASLIGDITATAYVIINADETVKDLVRRADNAGHGLSLTKEELIQQALFLHSNHNIPLHECCKLFNLRPEILESRIKSHQIRRSLEKMGINTTSIPHSTLLILAVFGDKYKVLEELGRTIAVGHMTAEETKVLIGSIEDSDELTQIEQIKELRNKMVAAPGTKKIRRPIRQQLLLAFDSKDGFYERIMHGNNGEPISLENIQFLSAKEAKQVSSKIAKLSAYLVSILKEASKRK